MSDNSQLPPTAAAQENVHPVTLHSPEGFYRIHVLEVQHICTPNICICIQINAVTRNNNTHNVKECSRTVTLLGISCWEFVKCVAFCIISYLIKQDWSV